jgi:hypothetical protein
MALACGKMSLMPDEPTVDVKSPSPTTTPAPPGAPSLADEKLTLEIEKLKAEIAQARAETAKANIESEQLKRPWHKKSAALQPAAVIVVTLAGTLVGFSNGWFSTKLESLHNQQDKSDIELNKLDDRRSELHREIANLESERGNLNQNLAEVVRQLNQLQANYKNASAKALQGERYRNEVEKIQSKLQQATSEEEAAKAAVEAARWHEGDTILITVQDLDTKKPVADYSVSRFRGGWSDLRDLDIGWLITPDGKLESNEALRWSYKDGKLEPMAAGAPYDRLFWTRKGDKNGQVSYKLTKDQVRLPYIQLTFSKDNYEYLTIAIPAGIKSYPVFLKAKK